MFTGSINRSNTIEVSKAFQNEYDNAWGQLVESVVGTPLTDERKSLLTRMAHVQYNEVQEGALFETASFGTLGYATGANTIGLGNPSFGSTIGSGQAGFHTGAVGSGDKWMSPFAIAMQVAAKTVGFDIVPTIPISAPTGMITYVDYQYADGKLDGQGGDAPILIKLATPSGFTGVKGGTYLATSGSPTTGSGVQLTYVGKSRILGQSIFKVGKLGTMGAGNVLTETETLTLADVFDGSANIYATVTNTSTANVGTAVAITTTPDLVNAFEDQVTGFAGGKGGMNDATFNDNWVDGQDYYEGMLRGESEASQYRTMGLKTYNKYIETKEFKAAITVTQQQLQDMKRVHGFDIISKAENALVNEVSQNINKAILATAFAMGWTNHKNLVAAEGDNLNLNLVPSDAGTVNGATYIDNTKTLVSLDIPAYQNYSSSTAGFDNQTTLISRLVTKINYASDIILQRGRRGAANFIVTNIKIASAIRSIGGYTFQPFKNNLKSNDLYPVGTIEGMTLYVDPNMKASDTRVLVGYKGADDEPGLKFCSYILSESVSTIAEQTMAPKIGIISRYALVEYGQNPETQYLTFFVKVPTNGLV